MYQYRAIAKLHAKTLMKRKLFTNDHRPVTAEIVQKTWWYGRAGGRRWCSALEPWV